MALKAFWKNLAKSEFSEFTLMEKSAQLPFIKLIRQSHKIQQPFLLPFNFYNFNITLRTNYELPASAARWQQVL
jgi:hypothetical protein